MSGNQQALLMAGGGTKVPPVQSCIGDEYYLGPSPFTILSLHGESIADSSFSTKTITNTGGVAVSALEQKFGSSSLLFSGSAYLQFAPVAPFDFASLDFTVEGWIYPTVFGTPLRPVFTVCEALTANFNFWYFSVNTNGVLIGAVQPSGVASVVSASSTTGVVQINQWQHVAMCRRGNVVWLFHNGIPVASSGNWALYPTAEVVHVALGAFGNGFSDAFVGRYEGYVDDWRVTSGAARYIPTNLAGPAAAPTSAPADPDFASVLLLVNGDVSLADVSSTPKTASNTGTTRSTAVVRYGAGSVRFPGTGTVYSWNNVAAWNTLQTSDFTIELWAYRLGTFGSLLARRSNSANGWTLTDRGLRGALSIGGGASTFSNTWMVWAQPPANTWNHFALVRKGTNLSMFINGVLSGTLHNVTAFGNNEAQPINLGSLTSSNVELFDGYFDDIRISTVARYDWQAQSFTPPTLTFCDSVNSQFTGQTNGTDFPRGQEVVSSQGTMRVLNPWVRLQGQQLLSTQGSLTGALPNRTFALTGQQIQAQTGVASPPGKTVALSGARVDVQAGALRVPPYPNLVSSEVSAGPQAFPGTGVPAAVAVFSTDGTYTVTYAGGSVRTGNWIDVASSAYNIADIASQYSIRTVLTAFPSLVTPSAPLPAALGTTLSFFVVPGIGSFTVGVLVVPRINNPRYGELGYVSQTDIEFRIE